MWIPPPHPNQSSGGAELLKGALPIPPPSDPIHIPGFGPGRPPPPSPKVKAVVVDSTRHRHARYHFGAG